MKIVKLNRRFRQFKEHGHVVALRFEGYTNEAGPYERACRERLSGHGWSRDHVWYGYYGDRNRQHDRNAPRPYWITFRREQDLTLVLLATKKETV